MDNTNERTGLKDFYVLYCCNVCHAQFSSKKVMKAHREICIQKQIDQIREESSKSNDEKDADDVEGQDKDNDSQCELKITNVCSMASPEIDGFEMECEEIEEERHSDVEEDDVVATTEPCTKQIILPPVLARSTEPVPTKLVKSSNVSSAPPGQNVVFIYPNTASNPSVTTTQATTATRSVTTTTVFSGAPMCTVINSSGQTTLVPQSIVQTSLKAGYKTPVTIQTQSPDTANGPIAKPLILCPPAQSVQNSVATKISAPKQTPGTVSNSEVKLLNIESVGDNRKILYVPAQGNTPAPQQSGHVNLLVPQVNLGTLQSPKVSLLTSTANSGNVAPSPAVTNLIPVIVSTPASTVSATSVLKSSANVIKVLNSGQTAVTSLIRAPVPLSDKARGLSTVSQPVMSSVPVQPVSGQRLPLIVSGPGSSTAGASCKPFQSLLNGQIRLSIPLPKAPPKPTTNVSQVLMVQNQASTNQSTLTTGQPEVSGLASGPAGPIQLVPVNVQPPTNALGQPVTLTTVPLGTGVLQPAPANIITNAKPLPVIFAPVSNPAVPTLTTKKPQSIASALENGKSSLSASPAKKGRKLATTSPKTINQSETKEKMGILIGVDKATGKVVRITSPDKAAVKTVGRKKKQKKDILKTNPQGPPCAVKIIKFSENSKPIVITPPVITPPPKRNIRLKIALMPLKPKSVDANVKSEPNLAASILPRKTEKKKLTDDEGMQDWVPREEEEVPAGVRRSSRIRQKPQKSYIEDSGDSESDDEDAEDEQKDINQENSDDQEYASLSPFIVTEDKVLQAGNIPAGLGAESNESTVLTETPEVQIKKIAGKKVAESDPDYSLEESDYSDDDSSQKRSNKRKKTDDPDFSPESNKGSDSEDSDEEEDEDDEEEDYSPPKRFRNLAGRFGRKGSKAISRINMEDHKDKYDIEYKTVENGPERKVYSCKVCDTYKCLNEEIMATHLSRHIHGRYHCPYCPFKCLTNTLNEHVTTEHPDKAKLVCCQCGERFFRKNHFSKHMATVHGEFEEKCETCGKGFIYKRQLRRHLHRAHNGKGMYECKKCGKCFIILHYYKRHVKAANCSKTGNLCQECGMVLAPGTPLQDHVRRVHRKERNFLCEQCPFTCYRIDQLRDHMTIHTGKHRYKCHLCDFTAAKSTQVTSHLRTHTGNKPFKCDKCNYSGAWNVQLKAHKQAHFSPNMVMCEPCGVAFKDDRGLNLHKKKHHSKVKSEEMGDNSKDEDGDDQLADMAIEDDCESVTEKNEYSSLELPDCGDDESKDNTDKAESMDSPKTLASSSSQNSSSDKAPPVSCPEEDPDLPDDLRLIPTLEQHGNQKDLSDEKCVDEDPPVLSPEFLL